jgi:hypothetical protein
MTPEQLETLRPLYQQAIRIVELSLLDMFMRGEMDADLLRRTVTEARTAPMEQILEESQRDLEQEASRHVR